MDFYKYLIGFNSNGLYTKVILPTITSFSPTNTLPSHSTWNDLINDSNIKDYYYPNIVKYKDYGIEIQLGESRDFTEKTSLGSILLSGTEECNVAQEIYGSLRISNYLYINNIRPADTNSALFEIENFKTVEIKAPLEVTEDVSATGKLSSDSYVEAPYFNATSDRRAKTNIAAYTGNATELVKKLPIYTFNYLSNNSASIGMIAQEAAIFDNVIPNFSLVNNEQATGENGDYMTIKESKLVYILWKAIQEQSQQIEELQKQVKQLSK